MKGSRTFFLCVFLAFQRANLAENMKRACLFLKLSEMGDQINAYEAHHGS